MTNSARFGFLLRNTNSFFQSYSNQSFKSIPFENKGKQTS